MTAESTPHGPRAVFRPGRQPATRAERPHGDRAEYSPAGGIVLCGGRSTRMGTPKAWLPVGDETFLGRTVRVVGAVCSPVVVVAADGQELPPLPAGVEVVRDAAPDHGPLQGLLAGLDALAGRREVAFVAACDLPALTPELVAAVVANLGDAAACVPTTAGRDHPLAAAYRLTTRDAVASLLAAGERRMTALLAAVSARRLPADVWAAVLRNVNTPQDYTVADDRSSPTR